MTQQQIHASTTMSITTSNIIHVIGCHSSCHRHGLLLVVLLLPMVECCNWRFFLLPCQLFLFPSPICQVAGTSHSTANAVATALTITTTLPLVLCCVVLQCAEILSRQRLHSWSCYRCHHHHHRISYRDTCGGKGMVSNRPASSSKRTKSSYGRFRKPVKCLDGIITKEIDNKPSTTLWSIGFMHQNDANSLCNCWC